MGVRHVTVALRALGASDGSYEADFLVDTGATDCLAPAGKLKEIGVRPVGTMMYELADGTKHEYPFGLVEVRFMGEITAGRVIFGPDDVEPVLGVTALESVGITIDPANRTLKRLPAIPLKRLAPPSQGRIAWRQVVRRAGGPTAARTLPRLGNARTRTSRNPRRFRWVRSAEEPQWPASRPRPR
jgi:clan AA aspartic protease